MCDGALVLRGVSAPAGPLEFVQHAVQLRHNLGALLVLVHFLARVLGSVVELPRRRVGGRIHGARLVDDGEIVAQFPAARDGTTFVIQSKVDLAKQGYSSDIEDPIYVLKSPDEGYVEYYDEYPEEVKSGKAPKSK